MALRANSIYAYTDLTEKQVFIKTSDISDTGAWSSSSSYVVRDAALYNGAYYICLTPNTNTPPDGNLSDEWSVLVVTRDGSSQHHTADEAYALAEEALEVAQQGSVFVQQGSEYAFDLFVQGTNYTNTQAIAAVQAEAAARAAADLSEAASRVHDDGTIAQQGSNYAFGLFVAGTNYTQTQAIAAVNAEAAIRAQHDLDEAAARVFGDGTVLASATNYANSLALNTGSLVGQAGSAYAFSLYVQGTNYTQTQITVEAASRAAADIAEAAARVHDDGTVAQRGSEYAFDLYLLGTNYTNGQVAAAVINANSSGSAYSYALYVAGTNFTTSSVAAEAAIRAAADTLIRTDGTIFTVTQVGAEAATRAAADAQVQQQGSQFALITRDFGTNYTNSQVAAEAALRATGDTNTFNTAKAYTDAQIANLSFSAGTESLALYWAGTAYTDTRVNNEAITRAAADTALSGNISSEAATRAAADASLLSAITALQAVLGISIQGTVAYYMASVPRGKTDTKLTFINGVMTGVVASPFIWDDFSQYSTGTYPFNGSVTVPQYVDPNQGLIYGNAWGSYGTINTDIFTGTVAQDPITDYVLNGTASPLSGGIGFSQAGTFAEAYINGQLGFDLFETYAIGTVNTGNPINGGTYYINQATLFSW